MDVREKSSNEKRLIDANALMKEACAEGAYGYVDAKQIADAPTVDAVEVVRGKDCKHSILPSELTQRYGKPGTLTCHNRYAPCNRRGVSGDDFCSYGERRAEAGS